VGGGRFRVADARADGMAAAGQIRVGAELRDLILLRLKIN
jgi:hypothetical protein